MERSRRDCANQRPETFRTAPADRRLWPKPGRDTVRPRPDRAPNRTEHHFRHASGRDRPILAARVCRPRGSRGLICISGPIIPCNLGPPQKRCRGWPGSRRCSLCRARICMRIWVVIKTVTLSNTSARHRQRRPAGRAISTSCLPPDGPHRPSPALETKTWSKPDRPRRRTPKSRPIRQSTSGRDRLLTTGRR